MKQWLYCPGWGIGARRPPVIFSSFGINTFNFYKHGSPPCHVRCLIRICDCSLFLLSEEKVLLIGKYFNISLISNRNVFQFIHAHEKNFLKFSANNSLCFLFPGCLKKKKKKKSTFYAFIFSIIFDWQSNFGNRHVKY